VSEAALPPLFGPFKYSFTIPSGVVTMWIEQSNVQKSPMVSNRMQVCVRRPVRITLDDRLALSPEPTAKTGLGNTAHRHFLVNRRNQTATTL
jgi:hypothetical protein